MPSKNSKIDVLVRLQRPGVDDNVIVKVGFTGTIDAVGER
jgi:hypothetical protein